MNNKENDDYKRLKRVNVQTESTITLVLMGIERKVKVPYIIVTFHLHM